MLHLPGALVLSRVVSRSLEVEADRSEKIIVGPDRPVPRRTEVFGIGDSVQVVAPVHPRRTDDLQIADNNRYVAVLAGVLIAYGIILPLSGYLSDRSFWGDEVAIALNVRLRTFAGLFRHLDFEQTMPIPLLEIVKATVSLLGVSEYAFRLPLLIAGCVTLIVIWFVFRHLFGVRAALISVAMAATSEPLIYYSSELKQYGVDALITVLTVWFGLKAIGRADRRSWRVLTAWGVVALCFSQPAVFVLASVGAAAVLHRKFLVSGEWRSFCFIASFVWLLTFTALYFGSYRDVSHSAYMRAFWEPSFLHPASGTFANELSQAIYILLGASHFCYMRALFVEPLFVVGVYGVWRRFGREAAIITTLLFFAVLISALFKLYPIADRLVVFTAPLGFLIYAVALLTLATWLPRAVSGLALILLAVLLLTPTAVKITNYAFHFPPREGSRQVVAQMNAIDAASPVYILFDEYSQWGYYADDWSQPKILEQNLARAFHAHFRVELVNSKGRREISGALPATSAVDTQWISEESRAILGLKDTYVWLFVPVYINNPMRGRNLAQRKLLERLQESLTTSGAELVNSCSLGDTRAFRYRLPVARKPNGSS